MHGGVPGNEHEGTESESESESESERRKKERKKDLERDVSRCILFKRSFIFYSSVSAKKRGYSWRYTRGTSYVDVDGQVRE